MYSVRLRLTSQIVIRLLQYSLGHFYLSNLLLPSLKAAATNSPDHVARVINVSSQTHVLGRIDFDTLTDTQARRKLGPDGLYNQSKFVSETSFLLWKDTKSSTGKCRIFTRIR